MSQFVFEEFKHIPNSQFWGWREFEIYTIWMHEKLKSTNFFLPIASYILIRYAVFIVFLSFRFPMSGSEWKWVYKYVISVELHWIFEMYYRYLSIGQARGNIYSHTHDRNFSSRVQWWYLATPGIHNSVTLLNLFMRSWWFMVHEKYILAQKDEVKAVCFQSYVLESHPIPCTDLLYSTSYCWVLENPIWRCPCEVSREFLVA